MPNVKERAEDMATTMNEQQQAAIRMLANQLHRLNAAVAEAVNSGLSVELQRASRHHHQDGYWGDLMTPIIVKQK
ncbi:MAG: SMc00767 family acetate metabolism repressor [Salinarimonas sp.]